MRQDPHKVDRLGPLRARQLALGLVREAGATDATVQLGWLPGQPRPDFLVAIVDGQSWDASRIEAAVRVPDLSIAGSFRQLELGSVSWRQVLEDGYFGSNGAWERP